MTDQTKIRNFFIIAHIDRVAPSSISFASAGWLKLIHSAGAPFPAKPAALRLCGAPILILSARLRRTPSETGWVDLPDGRCA